MKNTKQLILNFFIFLCFHSPSIKSQQNYSANQIFNCTKESLYACNDQHNSCTSFLLFNPQPPYTTVTTIAALFSSNPSELAGINNVPITSVFPPEKQTIVPVNCSCSNQHYQSITNFKIKPESKTYFTIANLTFQGLTTCGSLKLANRYNEFELKQGFDLRIPIRCACPTKNQILNGTKFLLTYPIAFGDTVNSVAAKFNLSAEIVLNANGLSETSTLFPFTTLLIPLPEKPSISLTLIRNFTPTTSVSFVELSQLTKSKKPLKAVIVFTACSALVFTVVLLTVLGVIYLRKQGKEEDKDKKISPEDLLVEIASFERVVKVYCFKEIKKATENFACKRKIKGSVYRGVFGNKILAVKKLGIDVCKQVNMLSKINHVNLTKLYGFCNHQDSWYLVFEFMEMGCLKDWLKETHGLCERIKIAIDVACGLRYLHNFAKPGYVHCNINSSNILLDGNLRGKISSFSLARRIDGGNDINTLTKIVGTRGYMAPEFVGNGLITSKLDVYSFGVVLLELITGKDAVVAKNDSHEVLLSTPVCEIVEGEDGESEIRGMIDLGNEDGESMKCAIQVVKLSLGCLNRDPERRPSMDEVVSCLIRIQDDLQTDVDSSCGTMSTFDFGDMMMDVGI